MHLKLEPCDVRSLRPDDAESLTVHANNREVWINLRDGFPHPYTLADADNFIKHCLQPPETTFAIAVDGEAVGAMGFVLGSDVERVSAELGYWLGESFWGSGIVTAAVSAVTDYAIREHHLTRIYATPFAGNNASMRVLEKAGYLLEGIMRRSAIKDGKIIDEFLYAFVVASD